MSGSRRSRSLVTMRQLYDRDRELGIREGEILGDGDAEVIARHGAEYIAEQAARRAWVERRTALLMARALAEHDRERPGLARLWVSVEGRRARRQAESDWCRRRHSHESRRR